MDNVNELINVKQKFCKLKSNFVSRYKVVSTSSKKIFGCVVPKLTTYVVCSFPNIIICLLAIDVLYSVLEGQLRN